MTTKANSSTNWASAAYDLLTKKNELTITDRKELYGLFSQSEEYESLSYRKIRILALLKCGYESEEIILYLYETAKLYPYKPLLYNHFFILGDASSVTTIFRQVASRVRCFFWSNDVLKRILELINPIMVNIVMAKNNFVCSNCQAIVPQSVPCNYNKLFEIWIQSIVKKNVFKKNSFSLYQQFSTWMDKIISSKFNYSVVVDGANVGRLIQSSTETLSFIDIDHVTQTLISRGQEPCIILNESHKNNYLGDTSRIIWTPRHINDDICWMALALNKPNCTFVSNDKCTNWQYILEKSVKDLESYNLSEDFKVWFETYRRPIHQINGKIIMSRSKGYSRKYFFGNNHSHLPLSGKNEWLCWK